MPPPQNSTTTLAAAAAVPVLRIRMELNFAVQRLPAAVRPSGIVWQPWQPGLENAHAAVLYEGFRGEADADLLRSLSTLEGCSELLHRTSSNCDFIPEGTWLASVWSSSAPPSPSGAIQVIGPRDGAARILNLAIIPEWRGRGVGRALLLRSLRNCRELGFRRVQLDVTATNHPAVELYAGIGFRPRRTFYCRPSASGTPAEVRTTPNEMPGADTLPTAETIR